MSRASKMELLNQLEQQSAGARINANIESDSRGGGSPTSSFQRSSKMEILQALEAADNDSPTSSRASSRRSTASTSSKIVDQMEQLNNSAASPKMSRWDYLTSLDNNTAPAAPNLAPANQGENFYDEMPYSSLDKSRPCDWCRALCDCFRLLLCNRKMACVLLAVGLMTALSVTLFGVASLRLSNVIPEAATATVKASSVVYMFNEDIEIHVTTSQQPETTYWVGLWKDGQQPRGKYYHVSDYKPAMWTDYCDATTQTTCPDDTKITFSENTKWSSEYTIDWPLCNGKWVACVMDTATAGVVGCSSDFAVYGGTCDGVCKPATGGLSYWTHEQPREGAQVSRIAFGSCFEPDNQVDNSLWDHLRNEFKPQLWVWLGDTIYADGEDMDKKRYSYNMAKNDPQYLGYGPLASPKIPVTGTWDDHDSGVDNSGAEYQCHKLAQDEFAHFFDLPDSDPRHPAQGDKQQKGVYSSLMFTKPPVDNSTTKEENGVHLVLLDVRTFRSPTFEDLGYCEGRNSTMLGEEQWRWLDVQLHQPSAVKVIGTGMQVMQPTDQKYNDVKSYCANDDTDNSFFDAINAIGEDSRYLGTQFESWNQFPQEKTRLLQMLQQSIHEGNAQRIVIISGDMHWGEMMAKEMPVSSEFGAAQVLYEVTASGIDKNWPYPDANSNRLRVRSADERGDGVFLKECSFPFFYDGQEYNDCTWVNEKKPWCAIAVDEKDNYVHPNWGYCQDVEKEIVPRANITTSPENACEDSMHICRARSNYGGIEIDWEQNFMTLSIFTPHADEKVAAQVKIGL